MDGHKTIYDEHALIKMFDNAGFDELTKTNPFNSQNITMKKETFVSHQCISCVVEAIKT